MLKSQNYSSLENQFLLAMPQLGGSYFEDSVTYLWKHTAEGAIGIVINKPLQYTEMDNLGTREYEGWGYTSGLRISW